MSPSGRGNPRILEGPYLGGVGTNGVDVPPSSGTPLSGAPWTPLGRITMVDPVEEPTTVPDEESSRRPGGRGVTSEDQGLRSQEGGGLTVKEGQIRKRESGVDKERKKFRRELGERSVLHETLLSNHRLIN